MSYDESPPVRDPELAAYRNGKGAASGRLGPNCPYDAPQLQAAWQRGVDDQMARANAYREMQKLHAAGVVCIVQKPNRRGRLAREIVTKRR